MLQDIYQGRASALELLDGQVTAIYADQRIAIDAPVLAPE